MWQKLSGLAVRALPQKKMSKWVGRVTKSSWSRWMIPFYAKWYGINAAEAEKTMNEYPHMTAFFARKLRPHVRPIDPKKHVVVSPADGMITSFGRIRQDTLLQAKGKHYSLRALLGDYEGASVYQNGFYVTIYLSPKDYHRIHAPFIGDIIHRTYVPGRLYPVNRMGMEEVKGLYTKNERVITHMKTESGAVGIVKVGAFIVGSVQTSYPTTATATTKQTVHEAIHPAVSVEKGAEIGHFEFGSTVILLLDPTHFSLCHTLKKGQTVRLGQAIARAHNV